ncbi:MAG: helix-turn-helix transcriptional regulator [Blastocatellia bacterium]
MARRTWEQYEKYLLQQWPLTRREVRIAVECLKGNKNKQIAGALGISAETVKKHLDHIYRLTAVNGREQLAAELLIADIDNTPLQQSLSLAGEGASVVGAGFVSTLYASRSKGKRPRTAGVSRLPSRKPRDRPQPLSPSAAEDSVATSESALAVAAGDVSAPQRWLTTESNPPDTEDGGWSVSPTPQMSTVASES